MGNKGSASVQENYRKTTRVVQPCDEDERGAHSEKNARGRDTREKKKRAAKPKMERGLLESCDTGKAESRQHNKQGSMEEENKQSYRGPQMTEQARVKEDIDINSWKVEH